MAVVDVGVHVGDGGAIADHIAVEVPCIAQVVLQKHGIRARLSAVNRDIGAHCRTERWQMRVFQIMRRDLDIESVAQGLGAAVYRIVLRSRNSGNGSESRFF